MRTYVGVSAKLPVLLLIFATGVICFHAQKPQDEKVSLGSQTAKEGFRNETEIAAKFNNWQTDEDAKVWLGFMGYKPADVASAVAIKPHGEKSDVLVKVKTSKGEFSEGISIKLVSTANGFNQIDKRWLSHYTRMWKLPDDVAEALKLFLGEKPPLRPSRNTGRMFLNELDVSTQERIVKFFSNNKTEIVSDLLRGDGLYKAGWMMVALKSSANPRWVLRDIDYAIKFFGEGPVTITRSGNLKIGRITMQRKGGDGGRETARMLQFKINPALLFDQ